MSKINAIKNTLFAAAAKKMGGKQQQYSIQIYSDEGDYNYWYIYYIEGKYSTFSSSILLPMCSDYTNQDRSTGKV